MDELKHPSDLRQVEVFEDRAGVLRAAPLPATAGRCALVIGPLSPLISESSLALIERSGVEVEASVVRRELLSEEAADPARVEALRERHEAHERELEQALEAARRANERVARAVDVGRVARKWAAQATLTETDLAGWLEELAALEDSTVEAEQDAALAQERVRDLKLELAFDARALALARSGRGRRRAFIELRLLLDGSGGELSFRYTLPCALWRPVHEAWLDDDQLHWQLGAMVWNATGEDWTGADLRCSTERPGDDPSPPALRDETLHTQRRADTIEVEARDEAVNVAREGGRQQAQEALGVDDGGEVRVFVAEGPVDIPSDGRPVHVPLGGWSAPAERAWLAFPERSALAVLRSRQVNAGRQPLLAGPVVLRRGADLVGRGQIGLVPAGEPFDLGWGSHDSVVLSRRQDIKADKSRLTGSQTRAFTVSTRLSHLGDDPVTIEIKERLPVSELKEVSVSAPQAKPALTSGPDEDGFVTWRLELKPGEDREVKLSYSVEASAKVSLPW